MYSSIRLMNFFFFFLVLVAFISHHTFENKLACKNLGVIITDEQLQDYVNKILDSQPSLDNKSQGTILKGIRDDPVYKWADGRKVQGMVKEGITTRMANIGTHQAKESEKKAVNKGKAGTAVVFIKSIIF